MLIAPAAPAPTAMHSTAVDASTRMQMARREIEPDAAGEDDERHDPRLQQPHRSRRRPTPRVRPSAGAHAGAGPLETSRDRYDLGCHGSVRRRAAAMTRQLVEAVERRRRLTVHSSVVAPSPQELAGDLLAGGEGVEHDEDEEQRRRRRR